MTDAIDLSDAIPCPKCGRGGFATGPETLLSRCACGYVEAQIIDELRDDAVAEHSIRALKSEV
jgi:hypothetical protein